MVRIKPLLAVDTEAGTAQFLDRLPDDATFVIVIPLTVPLALRDNLIGNCYACGGAVQFRPGLPDGFPKVCLACLPDFVAGMETPQ